EFRRVLFRSPHPRRIDIGETSQHVETLHEVLVRIVPPVLGNGVRKLLAVAGRAVEVDRGHHVSARREQRVIPARSPVVGPRSLRPAVSVEDRKSTRLNSSHGSISYAVFCLKKKKK